MSHGYSPLIVKAAAAGAGSLAYNYAMSGSYGSEDMMKEALIAAGSSYAGTKISTMMNQEHNFTQAAVCGAIQTAAINFMGGGNSQDMLVDFLKASGMHYASGAVVDTVMAQRSQQMVSRAIGGGNQVNCRDYGCY